jgi:hypothetical protein
MNIVNPLMQVPRKVYLGVYTESSGLILKDPLLLFLDMHQVVIMLEQVCLLSQISRPVTEQNVFGDFSYTLKLNETSRLALGIKAGVSFHQVGLRDIQSSLARSFRRNFLKILMMHH